MSPRKALLLTWTLGRARRLGAAADCCTTAILIPRADAPSDSRQRTRATVLASLARDSTRASAALAVAVSLAWSSASRRARRRTLAISRSSRRSAPKPRTAPGRARVRRAAPALGRMGPGRPDRGRGGARRQSRARRHGRRASTPGSSSLPRRRRGDLDGARSAHRAARLRRQMARRRAVRQRRQSRARAALRARGRRRAASRTQPTTARSARSSWRAAPDHRAVRVGRHELGRAPDGERLRLRDDVRASTRRSTPATRHGLGLGWQRAARIKVFWNGALAIEDAKYRDFDPERMGRTVTLARRVTTACS